MKQKETDNGTNYILSGLNITSTALVTTVAQGCSTVSSTAVQLAVEQYS